MTRVSTTAARKDFDGTLDRVARKGTRIVLQRGGKDVAALVPVEDLIRLEELEERLDAEEARRRLADPADKAIPCAEARRTLGLRQVPHRVDI
jgi:prevent-host-death family protein